MARRLIKDTCDYAAAIMAGEQDENLEHIMQACRARLKGMWRPGIRVVLGGTQNPKYEGREGVVVKVNQRTIVVGLGERDQFGYETELNVPPSMLRALDLVGAQHA